jgi:hypothetical protein
MRSRFLDPDPTARPAPEIDAFLRENGRAYVFVSSGSEVRGWPLTAFYQPALLYFTTYGKSPKIAHMKGADEAVVIVATPYGASPMRYATVRGPIRVVEFSAPVIERFWEVRQADNSRGPETRVDEAVGVRFKARLAAGKRVLIEIDVAEAVLGTLEAGYAAA